MADLQRGGVHQPPNGATRLQAGDHLILAALEADGAPGVSLSERVVEPEDLTAGPRLADLALPDGALAVMVRRGEEYLIPNGDTVLQAGDHLVLNRTDT